MTDFASLSKVKSSSNRRSKNNDLDPLDVTILRALATNARVSMAELARAVGLSPPSVAERVRRLEELGVVGGYTARIDPAALGLPLSAYVRIRPLPGELRTVIEILRRLEPIVACDRVTGDDCLVAKVHVRSVEDLEAVIDQIMPFAMTNTSIIQSSPVPDRLPPIPGAGAGDGSFAI